MESMVRETSCLLYEHGRMRWHDYSGSCHCPRSPKSIRSDERDIMDRVYLRTYMRRTGQRIDGEMAAYPDGVDSGGRWSRPQATRPRPSTTEAYVKIRALSVFSPLQPEQAHIKLGGVGSSATFYVTVIS